ncbi:MAG TPA: hypothetical protein VNH19_08530 [Candidatus Limnocylindrales bacterium]|nr:hypothetical protein [Candidatus Limnocylindrales bacterium]
MRKYGRTDGNHKAIFDAWRKAGASVLSLAPLGNGAPDALVCWKACFDPECAECWCMALCEIKDGSRKPSEQRLTEDEAAFHAAWPGKIHVIHSIDEALELIK